MEKLLPRAIVIAILLALAATNGKSEVDDILVEQWKLVTTTYLRYDATQAFLDLMKQSFPENLNFYSIGKSVQGREMYVVRMGKNVDKPETKRPLLTPKIRMVGNVYGDDTLGKQLLLMLIVDLLKRKRAHDERATRILDQTEIHLLLTMNPDGYEVAKEGECSPEENILGRLNANSVDLFYNFPEARTQEEIYSEERQPETLNVIKWIDVPDFVLSMTFFAGNIVTVYPEFTVPAQVEFISREEKRTDYIGKGIANVYYLEDVVLYIANGYAKNHKTMTKDNCNQNGTFPNGIINGAYWKNMPGSYPDWSMYDRSVEFLVGLSCCKSVASSTFGEEWENNKESIYKFIEAAHLGIKGVALKDGKPVVDEYNLVEVENGGGLDYTNARGEYWLLKMPGTYELRDESTRVNVTVENHDPPKATIQNIDIVSEKEA